MPEERKDKDNVQPQKTLSMLLSLFKNDYLFLVLIVTLFLSFSLLRKNIYLCKIESVIELHLLPDNI